MKKIILLCCFFLLISGEIYSQNNYNWITPNKTYLKLSINDDGVYRIANSDFTNAGISTSGINPRTVKVLYKGVQIPIYFQGEDDGTFDPNDYFDFYGQRNRGGIMPHRDGFSNAVIYNTDEYYNWYSDTSAYWVDWGGNNGLRMEKSTYVSQLSFPDDDFFKKVHFEKDTFYYLGETVNPSSDYRYFSNEIVVGESWFWKSLVTDESLNDTVTINDLSPSAQTCSLKLFVKPVSFTDLVTDEHRLEIRINNTIVDTLFRNNLLRIDTTITFSASLLNNNAVNNITLHYIPLGGQFYFPVVHVDYFELSYQRDFTIRNNAININLSGQDTTSKKFSLSGYNSGNPTNIYDIINGIRIENYSSSQGTLTFTGRSNSSFAVINNNIAKKPFRIVARQVKDLVSATNAADYLIIYNKVFESQANQLKAHRQSFDSFRVYNAEIQDIYDIFNYGIEDPIAVRNFTKYVYDNWTQPRMSYVCLFGRASLDPKKCSDNSTYFQNFVPTYGNPPSDGYFVNFNIGTFTYYHQISVGRLPVYTVTEAQDAVDKITEYDTRQPEKWWKNFISITGGGTRQEQTLFQNKSESLLGNYILPCPSGMQVSRIYRNDSAGYITYNYKDSIKKEIDRGTLMINFIGHAAAQDWEIGLEDPSTLNNGYKQPLVLSFTCYTGKNSETNIRSFGEKFFLVPDKCAIGFLGTTGWSFSGAGDVFNDYVLRHFARDSLRRIGELVSYASQRMSVDSGQYSSRNTINCYNLIGDPATSLLLPNTGEFDIRPNDYALSNPFPSLGEEIRLSAYPKNLGTCVDSIRMRFRLKKNGVINQSNDTIIYQFKYIDTVDHYFSIDSSGNYTMTVILDPYHSYPQKFSGNDSITFPLTLRNLSYVPVKPLDNSVLNTTSFKFTGLNPNIDLTNNNVKVLLQVDTSTSFDSPVMQTFNNASLSGVASSFNVSLPVLNLNTLYFIRTNAVINNDSSGWSAVFRTIYSPGISDEKEMQNDSAYTIYTYDPRQYNTTEISNLTHTPDGFKLKSINGSLTIRSYGSNGPEASYFIIYNGVNNITYYSDGGQNTGLNIARVRKLDGISESIKNFRMNSASSSDSVVDFLNSFDSSHYILTYVASYVPNSDSLRGNAKIKLREFGSTMADSVNRFDRFATWAFFGYLGADTSETCEKFHDYFTNNTWEILDCIVNPEFTAISGSISQTFGTADRWKNFSWTQALTPGSSILFDVYGINRDNKPVLLNSGLSNNALVNIDTINSYSYPNLKLTANIKIDTATESQSPLFKSVSMRYYPPAELIPDNYSFTGGDTLVQEGDSVRFSINYYNVGYIDVPVHIAKWFVLQKGLPLTLQQDTITSPLKIDSMRNSYVKFSTSGLRENKEEFDTIDLYFETSLVGDKNELFEFNNTAITKFLVRGDTLKPLMEVTYDGAKIQNGDYIQSKPAIQLQFFDDSRMVIRDTSNVRVYLDNRYVPYYINGAKNPDIDLIFPDTRFLQATVNYRPKLQQGEHKFRFVANDISGNRADSIVNIAVVDNSLRIHDIANYPNPMKTETNFLFMLSGELNPTSCKVKIYSVAGRLIKEINTPAVIGYNSIYWDGKDNDGDYIANGTYLYKFIIQGNSQVETSIQKLAILR